MLSKQAYIHHQLYNLPNTSTWLQSSTLHHHSITPNQQHHNHWLQQPPSPSPFQRTILTTLDMTKAVDTFNIHQLIHKIQNTQIPNTIKFLANYLNGRQQYSTYNNQTFKHKHYIRSSTRERLSYTLFNICMSNVLLPKNNSLNLITYADDITITSSHPNTNTAIQNLLLLLLYLNEIYTLAHTNNVQINPFKTTTKLVTPDPSE